MSTYRDQQGRSLEDYWRPSVAVDVALLSVVRVERVRRLVVLVHRPVTGFAAGRWALPGTFLHEGERLKEAALRALADKAGVAGRAPHQLRVFDEPDRDERGRVLSVAHVDLVQEHRLPLREDTTLAPVLPDLSLTLPGRQRRLPYDHSRIVRHAVRWVRARYRVAVDPDHLLPGRFTLYELRRVHEAVAGEPLQKDTFRRRFEEQLVETDEVSSGTVGRPARLFARRQGARLAE